MNKRGITPQGWHESPIAGKVHYQSSYEKKMMEWLDSHNLEWQKCIEKFPYIKDDGKIHKYNPDIYLPKYELYLEIKGMIRKNDPAKFEAFPKDRKISLLGYEELTRLGLKVFNGDAVVPDYTKWPYTLLEQIPDFAERGILSEELKERMSADKFFEILKNENIYYDI